MYIASVLIAFVQISDAFVSFEQPCWILYCLFDPSRWIEISKNRLAKFGLEDFLLSLTT